MKTTTETQKDVQGTDAEKLEMELSGNAGYIKEVIRKQKPSKTAVLTSVKTLRKNLKELGWEHLSQDLERLEQLVKNRIIEEL